MRPAPADIFRTCFKLVIFLLGFGLCACQHEAPPAPVFAVTEAAPPLEPGLPPVGRLLDAYQAAETRDAKAVVRYLINFSPKTPEERAWHRLLLGNAWLELEAMDKGLRLLQANYEELRDSRPFPPPSLARIMARSLKKLGNYFRDRQELDKALAYHQLEWLYFKRFGSLGERHEALISLDVDSIAMRNPFGSEQWLRESLRVAAQMPDGLDKLRAQIISTNNLAATLQELIRFDEAEVTGIECARLSRIYDAASKVQEFREVWALALIADIMGARALYVETKDPKAASEHYQKAKLKAMEASLLAERQNLSGMERNQLDQRLRPHCGNQCRPAEGAKESS